MLHLFYTFVHCSLTNSLQTVKERYLEYNWTCSKMQSAVKTLMWWMSVCILGRQNKGWDEFLWPLNLTVSSGGGFPAPPRLSSPPWWGSGSFSLSFSATLNHECDTAEANPHSFSFLNLCKAVRGVRGHRCLGSFTETRHQQQHHEGQLSLSEPGWLHLWAQNHRFPL